MLTLLEVPSAAHKQRGGRHGRFDLFLSQQVLTARVRSHKAPAPAPSHHGAAPLGPQPYLGQMNVVIHLETPEGLQTLRDLTPDQILDLASRSDDAPRADPIDRDRL